MDIHNIQIVLRNRQLDEIFDFAFLFLRTNLLNYIKLLAFPVIIFILVNSTVPLLIEYIDGSQHFNGFGQILMLGILLIEKSIIGIFLTIYNGQYLFNQKPSKRQVWKEFFKFLPQYTWNQIILRGIYIIVLSWSIFLPWRSVVTHFFKSEVILLEQIRGPGLNQRLSILVKGHIDRILLFVFLESVFFLVYVFVMLISYDQILSMLSLDKLSPYLNVNFSLLFLSIPVSLIMIPFMIFHSIAKFLFYIDSRSLKEGWDVELQLFRGIFQTRGIHENV